MASTNQHREFPKEQVETPVVPQTADTRPPVVADTQEEMARQIVELTRKIDEEKETRKEMMWRAQEDGVAKLRKLETEDPLTVFGRENFLKAFATLRPGEKVFIGCSDDRCGSDEVDIHRFCVPGSAVLNPPQGYDHAIPHHISMFQEMGVDVVATWHDGCGACAEAARRLLEETGGASEGDDVKAFGKKLGMTVAQTLSDKFIVTNLDGKKSEPAHMGYDHGSEEVAREKKEGRFIPMRGVEDYHDARKMVVDLSNRLFRASHLGIKPYMKLNRYENDPSILINDILLLLSIMMSENGHAPGQERFRRSPYVVTIVGDEYLAEGHPELSLGSFSAALQKAIDASPYKDAVQIVGFNAPSKYDCDAFAPPEDVEKQV